MKRLKKAQFKIIKATQKFLSEWTLSYNTLYFNICTFTYIIRELFESVRSACCRFLDTDSVSVGSASEMCVHSHRNPPSRDGWLLKDTALKSKQPRRRIAPLLPALLAEMQISQINDLEFLEFPSQTLCLHLWQRLFFKFFLLEVILWHCWSAKRYIQTERLRKRLTRCDPDLWV